ncbi:MAG: ATP-dependent RecD-like DNA helicase [Oscillospiraceae bacterium]|nr:ATP-dependent RecD-like DNA helicase [Oscillospiraceae bacterium]
MDNQDYDLPQLHGHAEAVVFRNEENGFTVLDFATDDGELVSVVGVLPQISPGEPLRLQGKWESHHTFGKQFKAQHCQRSLPATQNELLKYLSSGVIKGMRARMAQKIVEHFGEDTLHVLENQPQRLTAVRGITPEKAAHFGEKFAEQFSLRQAMVALERFGMTTAECLRVHKAFGARAAEMIQRNPYILCDGEFAIGFARADTIANAMKEPPLPQSRHQAGVLHVMKEHTWSNGHTCMPAGELAAPTAALLRISESEAQAAIDTLVEQRRLVLWPAPGGLASAPTGTDFPQPQIKPQHVGADANPPETLKNALIFLPALFNLEENIAKRVKFLLDFPPAKTDWDGDFAMLIKRMEHAHGLDYDSLQRDAMQAALEKGLLIITGGPGTGKTTTLKGILELFEQANLKVALAAPTGRAAKRMQELTDRPAKTIHRLLEVEWGEDDKQRFARNQQNPLSAQAVIIDEISMVDVPLFSALLDALPIGCRLVLVGDADQLPPVGPGCVLQDLMKTGTLPVIRLNKIFRQAMESLIITNSHAIVRGELPELACKDRDFFFLDCENSITAAKTIAGLAGTRLPKAYAFDPLQDIQVLCPTRRGECGTGRLNEVLQAALNPPAKQKKERQIGARTFRQGDKVMQVKNNYDLMWEKDGESGMGVFNGDIGFIEKIAVIEGHFVIRFDDDRMVEYPFEHVAEQLEHAFAITVHKAQGNEFRCVVMPMLGVPQPLAYRNLLYTGVTRAKQLIVLVGTRGQVAAMVHNEQKGRRCSALAAMLTCSFFEKKRTKKTLAASR